MVDPYKAQREWEAARDNPSGKHSQLQKSFCKPTGKTGRQGDGRWQLPGRAALVNNPGSEIARHPANWMASSFSLKFTFVNLLSCDVRTNQSASGLPLQA